MYMQKYMRKSNGNSKIRLSIVALEKSNLSRTRKIRERKRVKVKERIRSYLSHSSFSRSPNFEIFFHLLIHKICRKSIKNKAWLDTTLD